MTHFPIFPPEASTMAGSVDTLMLFVFLVALFFAMLIAGLILFFVIRYHHRRKVERSNPPDHNLAIELIWTGIPLAIVLVIFLWGSGVFVKMYEPPANAIQIYVVGKQWMWKIQHPEGRREINELHVPVGYPVKLLMTSQDVIHSFFVPAFRMKQDVLPGRYTTAWFQATQAGDYHLFCAQYCGTSHSAMTGKIIAMAPPDYERWLSGQTAASGTLPTSMGATGAALFRDFKCGDCHKANGTGRGPSLVGLFGSRVALGSGQTVTADENYIRESILLPAAKVVKGYKPIMPTFQGQLEEGDVMQLITYVESLKRSK